MIYVFFSCFGSQSIVFNQPPHHPQNFIKSTIFCVSWKKEKKFTTKKLARVILNFLVLSV